MEDSNVATGRDQVITDVDEGRFGSTATGAQEGYGRFGQTSAAGGTSSAAAQRGGGHAGQATNRPGTGSSGSSNFGFARNTGRRRVIGTTKSIVGASVNGDGVTRSYKLSSAMQFNDVDEMQADAISRVFAQDIIEELFITKWGLNSKDEAVMRKAEDVMHSFLIMRTASPYASYDLDVMIGEKEVTLRDLSDLLVTYEVQRRRFTRAIADDLKNYILLPDNFNLRNILITNLAVYPQYVHLAFDGSTKCSGMNRHEIAFTKSLESDKLFDDPAVQGKLANASLMDGVFDSGATTSRKRVAV